jgi:hypothetical protein
MTTRFVSGSEACLQAPANNSVKEKYNSRFMVSNLSVLVNVN